VCRRKPVAGTKLTVPFDPRDSPILTLGPLFAKWVTSNGREGMEPPASIKRIMQIVDTARTVGPDE
jgi:peptide/nickel transport system substrate-binding protein